MKSLLLKIGIASSLGLFGAKALACSVAPINDVKVKNQFIAAALTKVGVSLEDFSTINGIQVYNYEAQYIWTPMCPKGIAASADVDLVYYKSNSKCSVSIALDTGLDQNDVKFFDAKIVREEVCQIGTP